MQVAVVAAATEEAGLPGVRRWVKRKKAAAVRLGGGERVLPLVSWTWRSQYCESTDVAIAVTASVDVR